MSVLGKLTGLAVFAGIIVYWVFVVVGFFRDTFNSTTFGHAVIYIAAFFITAYVGIYITPVGCVYGLALMFED